jgi:PIN domain nuclease of toxin-antitoxin system
VGSANLKILDTGVLIFDALAPNRLTPTAKQAIMDAEQQNQLFCSDISLWEIAMLIDKKRLDPGTDTLSFLKLTLAARSIQVLPITPAIASLSISLPLVQAAPADRIIAATTVFHHAELITAADKLRPCVEVKTIW